MFLNNKTQVLGFESQNLGFIVPRGLGGVGLARNNETQVLDAKTWVSLFRGAWGGAGQPGTTKPKFWVPKPGFHCSEGLGGSRASPEQRNPSFRRFLDGFSTVSTVFRRFLDGFSTVFRRFFDGFSTVGGPVVWGGKVYSPGNSPMCGLKEGLKPVNFTDLDSPRCLVPQKA